MARKADEIRERRLDRMRLGQAVCDVVTLISDPAVRVKIVPLTEAEFLSALNNVAAITGPDNLAYAALRDRRQAQEIILNAIREDDDLTQKAFDSIEEMMEVLEVADIDQVFDAYNEMMENSSPALDQIPLQELDDVKKALLEMDWNGLSGRSWYALKRFLGTLPLEQLLVNSPGSS